MVPGNGFSILEKGFNKKSRLPAARQDPLPGLPRPKSSQTRPQIIIQDDKVGRSIFNKTLCCSYFSHVVDADFFFLQNHFEHPAPIWFVFDDQDFSRNWNVCYISLFYRLPTSTKSSFFNFRTQRMVLHTVEKFTRIERFFMVKAQSVLSKENDSYTIEV
jgi:hypothetical protein